MNKQLKDVGEGLAAENASWTFGGKTPDYFENHIKRSIPFYDTGHDLTAKISDYFVKPDSICYELGTSTGTLIRALAQRHKQSVCWVGIDIEQNMIEKAREISKKTENKLKNIQFHHEDITIFDYELSDFIVSYYTIQFIHPKLRQELINLLYNKLNWGGAFLMFEKVRGPDARFQDMISGLYMDYKLEQNYTPDEIIAKSRSLKGILEPFSSQGNLDMLRRAGFVDIMTIFKHVCFEGILCIK